MYHFYFSVLCSVHCWVSCDVGGPALVPPASLLVYRHRQDQVYQGTTHDHVQQGRQDQVHQGRQDHGSSR